MINAITVEEELEAAQSRASLASIEPAVSQRMTAPLDQFLHDFTQKMFGIALVAIVLGTVAGLLVRGFAEWLGRFIAGPLRPRVSSATRQSTPSPDVPHCPKCNRVMVARTASKGARAGQRFWGCPAFPDCRATREMLAT